MNEIHDDGLEILSDPEKGLLSTDFLIILTYGTSTISVLFGMMKFLCFSPQRMIYLRGCWEYLSTLLICFLTPFVRKCFYGLCAFQLIVNIFMSGPSNTAVNKGDGIMTTSVIEARSNEASTDILIVTTSPVLTNITEKIRERRNYITNNVFGFAKVGIYISFVVALVVLVEVVYS